jgi:hypothetical protein
VKLRRSSILLAALGAVLICLAAIAQFVVTPLLTMLPGNTDKTVAYTGTATVLNSKALQTGDVSHALVKGVPVTIERRIHVVSTNGDVAMVADDSTLAVGTTKLPSSHLYAVDRHTLRAAPAPAGSKADPASGLTIGFPIAPKKDDSYRLYDSVTQTTGVAHFKGTEKRQGRTVNVYTATISGPVKNKATLAALPPALPKQLAGSLAPMLPADVAAKLAPAMTQLPDVIPLAYTGTTTVEAYVDARTGVALDQGMQQQIVAGVKVGDETANLLPVMAVDAKLSPGSQSSLADDVRTASRALTVLGAAPVALLVLGLSLLGLAVIVQRRAGRANRFIAVERSVTERELVGSNR